MRYRNLGAGIQVSSFVSAMIGGATAGRSSSTAPSTMGSTLLTANVYAKGESERIVGDAMRSP